jgi:membrane-bound lytic murein transglycosylase MltF
MKRALALVMTMMLGTCSQSSEQPPANQSPARISLTAIAGGRSRPVADLSDIAPIALGDLDQIVQRSYLRVLVSRSRTNFQVTNGRQRGRTVDIGDALEDFISERVGKPVRIVFIDTREDQLVDDLLAGKGDVAANLLLTFERDDKVAFAKPWQTGIREIVVTGPNEPHVVSLEDVGGRSLHVRKSSDHYASLVRLNAQLKNIARPPAKIVLASPDQTDEDLLDLVNDGKIPATVVDDYVYDACCSQSPGLTSNRDVAVSQDGSLSWVTRKDASQLLALLNEFFTTHAWGPGR